ncbi:hypothetical protein Syun_021058 [Stephania yunnanensis]|uniref:Uncharacterized protein n=1 Tax=Stephania yunnanensis TaxID=152371 RepID=A0AAP0IF21_9MAGN
MERALRPLDSGMNVDYRTILQKDLAKFVLSKGGWSKLLCTGEKVHRLVDVALVFVGKELQSSAISGNEHEDPTLLHLIKIIVVFFVDSFSRSNFSMAFPFVVASEESSNMEDSLITGFIDHCGHGLERKNVVVLESCAVDGYQKLDYLVSRVEKKQEGQTDLVIICSGSSDSSELDGAWSEGEALSELINYVEQWVRRTQFCILQIHTGQCSTLHTRHWLGSLQRVGMVRILPPPTVIEFAI